MLATELRFTAIDRLPAAVKADKKPKNRLRLALMGVRPTIYTADQIVQSYAFSFRLSFGRLKSVTS